MQLNDSTGAPLEDGALYWVKFADYYQWEPAEWCSVYGWYYIGYDDATRKVFKVGERLEVPCVK
jgi:hypothetical protein